MQFEILMSVMHQRDVSIARECGADADVLIINQCDRNEYYEEKYNGHKIRMISTTERGLSRSRNMALKNAIGDICLFCDDDEKFAFGYKEAILSAFKEKPEADIIAFNAKRINTRSVKGRLTTKFKKASLWHSYSSFCIAFQRRKVIDNKVFFDVNFGAGSGKITQGEETVWQYHARKRGLRIYKHPYIIAEVAQNDSTWFSGYNSKYFYNLGAFLSVVWPWLKEVLKYYYIFRLNGITELAITDQYKWLRRGIKGYGKSGFSYEEYVNSK